MGGGGTSDTKSTGALPWWSEQAHQDLIGEAETWTYGSGPGTGGYQQYNDPRIAGLTDPEYEAIGARQDMFDRGDVAGQFASNQLGLGSSLVPGMTSVGFDTFGGTFDGNGNSSYMNPYLNSILDPQLRQINESYDQRLNQGEAQNVARGASIGSHRVGLENTQLQADRAQALSDTTGAGRFSAYESGLGAWQKDQANRLGSLEGSIGAYGSLAGQADALGTNSQARELGMINELDRSGAIQREMQQKELNLNHQDFLDQQNVPRENMTFLSGILSGVPGNIGTTTQSMPNAGLASQLASLGLSAAAVQQAFGGTP